MSIGNKITKYFSNHAETSENHWDKPLQTHYYKAMKDKVFQTLENLFTTKQEFQINSTSEERGEMSVSVKKGKKAFIVVTVIMVSPNRTAVDFSVTTESVIPMDFGYSSKLINRLYEDLNKELILLDQRN
ncbi:cytosolic protein [Oceanobacillus halophilus]|uniref:Cytosolic protein n=1 Tax=Oceanobacillus halophilus TaxID=930130 RepID=A0A494ZUE2_9BACI|nr:cytosolic protein [Oceanobacillus halophilus]RKQ29916.1 cytosolic protein [Oceanobacillus halophilus]